MIFTSWVFLFGFLPLALLGYFIASKVGQGAARVWLIIASLTFYGFWAPYLISLIAVSILFNYAISVAIRRTADKPALQRALFVGGVTIDLAALFYYKYLYAIYSFVSGLGVLHLSGMEAIVLPLGISFFTFTQIGYLADCQAGITKDNNFGDYVLFVTFFPHLIAGPILYNGEMMPQFADRRTLGLQAANFAPGLTIFIIGMLKKSVLADPLSPMIAPGFADPAALHVIGGWAAALGYSLQLYFDFSGYTDMAIGLALMFNIRFPANFNSPYKARSIIDFWQRWHITLTRYLTQYLYNPIGLSLRRRRIARGLPMSRKAQQAPDAFLTLVAFPTILTMVLAGVWHGAGLQFAVFGALHGLYLTVNHAWRMYGPPPSKATRPLPARLALIVAQVAATYLAVLVGQVFFRAESCADAVQMLAAMTGLHGLHGGLLPLYPSRQLAYTVAGFAIALFLPNTQQIMAAATPILGRLPPPAPRLLRWRPSLPWAVASGLAGTVALLSIGGTVEFLYFQF
jgi:alginate O-acetyltransferase complex protein AlgI